MRSATTWPGKGEVSGTLILICLLCRSGRLWLMGAAVQAEGRGYGSCKEVTEMDLIHARQIYASQSLTVMAPEDDQYCGDQNFVLPWVDLKDLLAVGL